MIQLLAFQTMIFVAFLTSVMGAIYIFRGVKIFDLQIRTRNFMYIGASSAMVLGFVWASVFCNTSMPQLWHFGAATVCFTVGVFAAAHMSIDLCDRLRIVKRRGVCAKEITCKNPSK